jgi:transcriptional antiterminator NusG
MSDEHTTPEADDAVERSLTTATAVDADPQDAEVSVQEDAPMEVPESEAPEPEAPEMPEPTMGEAATIEEPEAPADEPSVQEDAVGGELEPLEPSTDEQAAAEPEAADEDASVEPMLDAPDSLTVETLPGEGENAEKEVVDETVPDDVEPSPDEGEPADPEAPIAVAEAPPETPEVSGDPFRGPGDWYVVHTYAGYENKVKANLESRIHTMQMEGKIFRVHIPMEDVMEIKSGKKQVVQKKVFPGYLLVKMFYDNDSWYVVRNTPGVTGFVSAGTGSKPTPLSKREVEKILVVKKEEQKPAVRLGFEENDVVRITSGPFADFNGTISEINPDQGKLKVLVNIFDRETPVELSFDQVSKV